MGGGGTAGGTAETYPKPATPPPDEDGSQLWLRYVKVPVPGRLAEYQTAFTHVVKAGISDTLQAAQAELIKGIAGLTGTTIPIADEPTGDGALVLGTPASSTIVKSLALASLGTAGSEGYVVINTSVGGKQAIVVAANTDIGVSARELCPPSPFAMPPLRARAWRSPARRRSSAACSITGTISTAPSSAATPASRLWDWQHAARDDLDRATPTMRGPTPRSASTASVLNNVNADAQILTALVSRQGRGPGRRAFARTGSASI